MKMPKLLLLALSCAGFAFAQPLQTMQANAPEVSYEGRIVVVSDGSVRQGFPGIVTRVRFQGTEMSLRASTTSDELYLDVKVDGGAPVLVKVPKGTGEVSLVNGLPEGRHLVEIFKRVESAVGILAIHSFSTHGSFLPAPALPEPKFLFLGDSFTAGQATTVEDGGPMDPSKALRQNARLSYGRILADRLHAQCHIIAYAGRGVMRDWQGVRAVRCAPEYYPNALPDDDATVWDPKRYEPDVIGVCLGNNDFDEGIPDQTDYLRVFSSFLRTLRRDAPNARIILITSPSLQDGPNSIPKHSVQRAYLEELARRSGDPKIQVVSIKHYEGVPGDWHPSGTAHRAIADELEPAFRAALQRIPEAVQVDLKEVLNARIVTTLAEGKLVTWSDALDNAGSGMATQAAAAKMGNASLKALPDDGSFAATDRHPVVKLNFSNAQPEGPQVRRSIAADDYVVSTPPRHYRNLALYCMSGMGASTLKVTLCYADASLERRTIEVPDWWNSMPSVDPLRFDLAKDLGKWDNKNRLMEPDHHYITGLELKPDPARILTSLRIEKSIPGVLTLWGITGAAE